MSDSLLGDIAITPKTPETPTPDPSPSAVTVDTSGSIEFSPALYESVGLVPNEDFDDTGKILGKYDNVKDLVKGYKEATTKLREKTPTAPDAYAFDFSQHETLGKALKDDWLADDPIWAAMEPVFKEVGVTQEQASRLMEAHLNWTHSNIPDLDAEKKRLGTDADAILATIQTAAPKLAKTEGDVAALDYIGRNADAVKLLHRMIGLMGEQPLPDGAKIATQTDKQGFREQALEIRKRPDFDLDPKLQQQYVDLLGKAT
jgi:hypothetical protein